MLRFVSRTSPNIPQLPQLTSILGFIILGIIINCGGVGDRGYLGAKYWYDPGAFKNGFNGFAGVFVVAAFAFGGTELVGLAAAESVDPRRAIPMASKQVFFRIAFFYVINLFILGLILPSNDTRLENSTGFNSSYSPFVLAIEDAGIAVLPSIFNAVITVSVISVANSCTFGSTRTMQAMAERGMAPQFLAYIDKAGRPLYCVMVQLACGLLGYVGVASNGLDVFNWLLSLSGLSYLFVWGSCCLAHIRFRLAWQAQGRSLREIPYRPPLGIWGSVIGLALNIICLIATFYNALYVSPTLLLFMNHRAPFSSPIEIEIYGILSLTRSAVSPHLIRTQKPQNSSRRTSLPRSSFSCMCSGRHGQVVGDRCGSNSTISI